MPKNKEGQGKDARAMTEKEIARFQAMLGRVGRRETKGYVIIAEVSETKTSEKHDGIMLSNGVSKMHIVRSILGDEKQNPMALIAMLGMLGK